MKNFILKAIAYVNGVSFIFFACALDSESWLPFIICCINLAWLTLFCYANSWFEDKHFC